MTNPTRRASIADARGYLEMAREFLAAAQDSLRARRYKAAGLNAVHAAISAADAVCAFRLRERAASAHHDATELLLRTGAVGAREKSEQLARVLTLKNVAEYEVRPLSSKETAELVKRAGRLVEWAGDVLAGRA